MFNLDPYLMALRIPALLIAITVHEFAHARVAYAYGDATAKAHGRMNLNPINHLDPIGTLMIILVGFGWAKPVPINPLNFSNYRGGLRWVSLAGPLSNFALGFVSLLLLRLMLGAPAIPELVIRFMAVMVQLNILLGVFNLIPIPPLDGSKILVSLAPDSFLGFYQQIERYAPIILLVLIFTRALFVIITPVYNLILSFFNAIIQLIPGL